MADTPEGNVPGGIVRGDAARRLSRAWQRYRLSDYDRRLWPEAYPTEEQQRLYDAHDRGEWPP